VTRLLHTLLPPPRQPLAWRAFLAPALFLLACAVAYGLAETLDLMWFTRLWPFLFLALVPWIWWLRLAGGQPLSPARATVAALSRMVLLMLLVLTLAEPRVVRREAGLAVVYALDRSASIQQAAMDQALRFVLGTVGGKAERDQAGLVFFGRDAAVELPPATALPFESINVAVDREGTDLAAALTLATGILPPDRQGRVVLISDGVATQGSLPPVLDDLAARGVRVDVLPVEYQTEEEVWLERLELPANARVGETLEPAVILESLAAGQGTLALEVNGETVVSRPVTFAAGRNRFTLPLVLSGPGYYELAARLGVPEGHDRWPRNNLALGALLLQGKGRILLVTDPGGQERDAEFIVQALLLQEREVVRQPATALPHDALALQPYDCIVFVNVPRDACDEPQLQAVHDAVFQLGCGFLMVGGGQSFGPGGWHRTVVEDLLPVSMDMTQRKTLPKGALAIILHTCEFAEGNTWGKRITQQAIKVLDPRDDVGVVAHGYSSGGDYWVVPMTPCGDYARLAQQVNAAEIGDMPGFDNPMTMAFQGLMRSDASSRHLIIISDCDPSQPTPELLARFQAAKVSISTVAVFPHGGADISTMRSVSASTGGRYYQPSDPKTLPAIFVKEARTLRRSAVQNKTFTPGVVTTAPELKGIGAMPPLHGYVLTMARPRAITILAGPETEDGTDPLLARWRYGVGAAAAFTSDLGDNWARDWVKWERFQPFVTQLVTELCRADVPRRLAARSFAARGDGLVQVEDHGTTEELLDLVAAVQGPDGAHTVRLEQVAPRRYEGRFPLAGIGRYRVLVSPGATRGRGAETETEVAAARAATGFTIAYGQEYLRFRSDPITLRQIAARTGGRVLAGDEAGAAVFAHDATPRRGSRPNTDWLLALLACLVPLDVALRRVQLDRATVLGWFARRPSEKAQTLGTLLARKEQVDAAITAARAPVRAAAPKRRAAPAASVAAPTATSGPPATPATPSGPQPSAAERLLAAKRRAANKKPS
jgi:uncharacterized membrane protein